MATFDYAHIYRLRDNGDGTYEVRFPSSQSGTFADDGADNMFEVGERVNGPGLGDGTGIYQGFTGNGAFIEYEFTGAYILYSNDVLNEGDQVTITTQDFTACFLTGTSIACPGGGRAVESLSIGDVVSTADGGEKSIRWIGRQTIVSVFADMLRDYPIRIAAGALGDGMPLRDLCLSPDHALLVDGLLVHASALVNGTSIQRVTRPDTQFTYYHIELDDHSLVLAEGVPAETFVDNVTRRRFDNYAEYEALCLADGPSIEEMDLPRVKSARQLPVAIHKRLAERAGPEYALKLSA